MPIIVNDFEIIVEPQPPKEQAQDQPAAHEEAQVLRPEEIVRIMQVHEERLERVRAD